MIHPVIRVTRDPAGTLLQVAEPGAEPDGAVSESILHIELEREPDREQLAGLRDDIDRILGDVRCAVEDWQPMRACTDALIEEFTVAPLPIDTHDRRRR